MVEIQVYPKEGQRELNNGQKAGISRRLHRLGFHVEWEGNSCWVAGAYYGLAIEAINDLGYETDEGEGETDPIS